MTLSINASAAINNVITNDESWTFTSNANDPGGNTLAGMTQATYNRLMKTNITLAPGAISKNQLFEAYDVGFWTLYRIEEMPLTMREPFFSCVINLGTDAVHVLQTMLGVKNDGVLGDVTIKALNTLLAPRYGTVVNLFVDAWVKHYMDLVVLNARAWRDYANGQMAKKPAYFRADDLEGWFNRANKYRIY